MLAQGLPAPRFQGVKGAKSQRLEQTQAGEALAAGSEPWEAAKPSSAKRVGVSPRQQPGRGPATGLDMANGPRHAAPSSHLTRGCQGTPVRWGGGDGGTQARWGSPGRAPQGRAGRAEAEDGDGDSSSSRGKGDNAEGRTTPSHNTPGHGPAASVGFPSASSPQTPPREGERGVNLCPLTPRALRERCGAEPAPRQGSPGGCWCPRGPRHFWSASASLRRKGRG